MVLRKVEEILAKTEGVESYQTIGGYGLVTNTYQRNYGSLFTRLHPWEERHGEALHVKGIMAGLQRQFAAIPEAGIFRSISRRCPDSALPLDSISSFKTAADP